VRADFNNNGIVDPSDLSLLKSRLDTSEPNLDINGNGIIDPSDLSQVKSQIGQQPGPGADPNAAASARIYFAHTDHLGTPTLLTDSNQNIAWQANYDPFGKATVSTEMVTNNIRFPGQYYDAETGWHYNMQRYYDPGTGRYLQSDPIGLAGGINTYAYALNNPLRYTDPTGQFVPALIVACAANPACDTAVATAVSATASAIGRAAIVAGVSSLVTSDSRYRNPQKVVRGGMCTADRFATGSGVTLDQNGLLNGVSVQSFPNTSVQELSQRQWIPNGQIGVTTVGDIQDAGGDIISDPTRNNPYHSELIGITPEAAQQLFTPTIPNPNPR